MFEPGLKPRCKASAAQNRGRSCFMHVRRKGGAMGAAAMQCKRERTWLEDVIWLV
ncbi:hypothetical protein PATSB16_20920 [Pandoraea thiooxydans]|nr:hypothetical protein PATSB16_20920 [Pandoraea thiooxydans]